MSDLLIKVLNGEEEIVERREDPLELQEPSDPAALIAQDVPGAAEPGQESCIPCAAASTVAPTAPAADSSNKSSDGASFTYDEGKGRKEIVQLSGPLSEIYTRALNIYYAKKPAFDEEQIPEDISQADTDALMSAAMLTPTRTESQASAESIQLDDEKLRAVLTAIQKDKLDQEHEDKFEFVNDCIAADIEATEPDVIAFMSPYDSALKPEVIDTVQTAARNKNKDVVMVITDNTHFFTKGMGARNNWIDLSDDAQYNPVYGDKTFDAAVESIYISNGIKVVNCFNGLICYLNKRKV